jgi:hypothetical protein
MTQRTTESNHTPTLARPGRRLFHTLIAAAGWTLFVWWWWIVIRSVSSEAVRFTLVFVGVTAAVVVLVTAVWSLHNLQIFKRKGPRTQRRPVVESYTRDRLGRHVVFAQSRLFVQSVPVILIRLEHQGKVYRASSSTQVRGVAGRMAIVEPEPAQEQAS